MFKYSIGCSSKWQININNIEYNTHKNREEQNTKERKMSGDKKKYLL